MTRTMTRATLAAMAFQAISLCVAQDVQVNMDGQALTFPDTQPQIMYGDNVMVPIRPVLEHMGGDVHWDDATQTITANVKGTEVQLKINDFVATVNGKYQDLQNAPAMVGGRTMIPMRFLADAFGAQVNWSQPENRLTINTTGTEPPASEALTLYEGQTIPIALDQPLSSNDSQEGDTFTATVNNYDAYGAIPSGTKVEGHVVAVHPMMEGQPGSLDLAFDRMVFPNGEILAIDGSPTSLYSDYYQNGPYDMSLETGAKLDMRINREATIYLSNYPMD